MDGRNLNMTKEGIMVKYGKVKSYKDAMRESTGGKKFKSVKEALRDVRNQLVKLEGK